MNIFKKIFKKEIKGIFHGGVGVIISLLIPLFSIPILLTSLIKNNQSMEKILNSPKVALFIKEGENRTNINKDNLSSYESQFYFIKDSLLPDLDATYKMVKDEKQALINFDINLSITFPSNIKDNIKKGVSEVDIIYNNGDEYGLSYATNLMSHISLFSTSIENIRLLELTNNTISLDDINPIVFDYKSIQDAVKDSKVEGINNSFLNAIIPSFITLLISFGSVSASAEIFSNEKEKKTLESLLSTSAKRSTIFNAKMSVNILFAVISLVLEGIGLLFTILINFDYFSNSQIFFTPLSSFLMILTLLSVPLVSSTLSSFGFVYSKNSKQALAINTILQFLPTLTSMILIFAKIASINSLGFMFVPIVGSIFAFRLAAAGIVNISYLVISFVINISLTIIFFIISKRCFNSERMISNI